jgi:GT2 family glycosyltransferase
MDISIIIVNYKSKGDTLNCIKSIREADFFVGEKKLRYEIIVVDNDSEDSIGEILRWQYPDVIFIQKDSNRGLGVANNAGIKKAQGKYIVIMNPDTIAFKDTFTKLFEYMEKNPAVGIVGPQQLNPDGSIQDSCFRWHGALTPVYRRTPLGRFKFAQEDIDKHLMHDFDHESERKVDWLLGSFLFVRAKALEFIGGFDERFFLYFEDTDFCRQFHDKNWEVAYNPEAKVIHNHARQSAQVAWWKFFTNKATVYHVVSWFKYIRKWGR